jgi:hypothetical protein
MIKAVPPAKSNGLPNVFPIAARFSLGFLRFLPILNNPWNLATARRWAAPDVNNCEKCNLLG